MARGRQKDLTIPPSRSLAQQRAYRDRRAKYVADLAASCATTAEFDIATFLSQALQQPSLSTRPSLPPTMIVSSSSQAEGSSDLTMPVSDSGSECCGGLLDCRGLIEEDVVLMEHASGNLQR